MLRSALAGTGLIVTPAAAGQEHAHHQQGARAEAAPDEVWTPLLFDAHQAATVEVLSERIIPETDTAGAREAQVVEYIDLILNDGDAEARNFFLEGLGRLDGLAIRRHGKPFIRCSEARQVALLQALDEVDDAFFREAKRLTAEGYFTSRIGIEELNKGGRVPETFACEHEDHA